MVYIGETGRNLATRFSEHLRDVQNGVHKPVSLHFRSSGHQGCTDMEVLGLRSSRGGAKSRFDSLLRLLFNIHRMEQWKITTLDIQQTGQWEDNNDRHTTNWTVEDNNDRHTTNGTVEDNNTRHSTNRTVGRQQRWTYNEWDSGKTTTLDIQQIGQWDDNNDGHTTNGTVEDNNDRHATNGTVEREQR
ncbi:hypothetical protein ElyMa_001459200 [Elysia marginata]|uniref:GIY-YIG domain-containing protein n=1 Tax=Elysia marginata TaxID=1093978 RepID=A0AAV4J0J8_9GAST|nr:hypothetical protein ElyMa_001459200 [Elysia marginata]